MRRFLVAAAAFVVCSSSLSARAEAPIVVARKSTADAAASATHGPTLVRLIYRFRAEAEARARAPRVLAQR